MRHLDVRSLREDGDIVWKMPRDWEFIVMQADGSLENVHMARNDMLYVCFLDIGLTADRDMHRLHLRTDPNRKEKRHDVAHLAAYLRDSIVRCAEHVRLLDHDRASLDRAAKNVAQGYYLYVWASCHSVRQEYLWKQQAGKSGKQKRVQTSDNRSWKAGDYTDSGSYNDDYLPPWHRRKKTCP